VSLEKYELMCKPGSASGTGSVLALSQVGLAAMHRSLTLAALVAGLVLLPGTTSAQALPQPWADPQDVARVDLSASISLLSPTDWSDLVLLGSISNAGVIEQILARELRVEPEKAYGGAVTYWEGRYGFRVQGGYSKSSLRISSAPAVGIKTWLYDVRGVIGALNYRTSRKVSPYGFVGFGGITYDLAQTVSPPLTFITQAPAVTAGQTVIVLGDRGQQFLLSEDELDAKTVFAVNVGVGTDFRLPIGPGGVALRVELSDHIAASPLGLRISQLSERGSFISDSGVRFGPVHHLSVSVGVVVQIGR
jgi:hypothetical protein